MCKGEKRICAALVVLLILTTGVLGLAVLPELPQLQLLKVGDGQ